MDQDKNDTATAAALAAAAAAAAAKVGRCSCDPMKPNLKPPGDKRFAKR